MIDRPDFSDYLAHFTTSRAPCSKAKDNPTNQVAGTTAIARLTSILRGRKILASKIPWNNSNAVCLTECPWGSLLDHAKRYSAYGIGFTKEFIFSKSGGPAYYVRADLYQQHGLSEELHPFATPFWPSYRPENLKNNGILKNKDIDYSHEREWRVPSDLEFTLDDVKFVVVKSYEDMAKFPKILKDEIGRSKFLIMDNYREVVKLWPL